MRVVELFSGIGATRVALDRVGKELGIPMEFVAHCDIDKYASKSYTAIFNDTNNLGDITKVEKLPECDMLTWSFPCQSLSKAGKCEGMVEGSGTASSLGWEVIRLLKGAKTKPEWLLMENVPAVHNKRNNPEFERIIAELSAMGYVSGWNDINAKKHGVAQNRNRCIMISRLNAPLPEFGMPRAKPLDKVLRDYLEFEMPRNEEEAKYLLTEKELERLLWKNDKNAEKDRGFNFTPRTPDSIAVSITTRSGQRETDNYVMIPVLCAKKNTESCEEVANQNRPGYIESANRVYGVDALCPTITTCQGGGHVKVIAYPVGQVSDDGGKTLKVINGDTQGWATVHSGDSIILGFTTGKSTARGRVQDQCCATLQTSVNVAVAIFNG